MADKKKRNRRTKLQIVMDSFVRAHDVAISLKLKDHEVMKPITAGIALAKELIDSGYTPPSASRAAKKSMLAAGTKVTVKPEVAAKLGADWGKEAEIVSISDDGDYTVKSASGVLAIMRKRDIKQREATV